MSSFNSLKKFLPAKKAWKSFKSNLKSNLREIKFSRAIKTTRKHCLAGWQSVAPLICRKFQALTRQIATHRGHRYSLNRYQHYNFAKSSAIYVDEFFPGQAKELIASGCGTSTLAKSDADKKVSLSVGKAECTSRSDNIPPVPQFKGVMKEQRSSFLSFEIKGAIDS